MVARPAADPLLSWRDQFDILKHTTYMISHSLGAMPRGVHDQMRAFADLWNERGIQAWEDGWWDLPFRVGNLLGEILGADPGTITMHQNVSVAESIIASCLDFAGMRNKVVYTDMNFPSVTYVWEARVRSGARIHMVASDDGITVDTGKLVDAIDDTTLVVPISHVLFRSAFIQDVRAVVEKAERVGALVILERFRREFAGMQAAVRRPERRVAGAKATRRGAAAKKAGKKVAERGSRAPSQAGTPGRRTKL